MNSKIGVISPNPTGYSQKETSHNPKKVITSKDNQLETFETENMEKLQIDNSKNAPSFDCSNLSVFFGSAANQTRTPSDNVISKPLSSKKPSEPLSTKEGPMKPVSSRDLSNLSELTEDTIIINNPNESKPVLKKRSVDVSVPQNTCEDMSDAVDLFQTSSLEAALLKNLHKKASTKSSLSTFIKATQNDKPNTESSEDLPKLDIGRVLERIKPKPYTKSGPNGFSPANVPEVPVAVEQPKSTPTVPQVDPRVINKIPKAVSPLILPEQDKELYSENNEQQKFIYEIFESSMRAASKEVPLDKSKEISQENINPVLLTQRTASNNTTRIPDPNSDTIRDIRKKPNLSLMSTDSTVDSETLAILHKNNSNSFLTPVSAASGGFANNPGKIDLNSPRRVDSGASEQNNEMNFIRTMQKNMYMNTARSKMGSQNVPSTNLNQSCMTFYGSYTSGNSSDRSLNQSMSEEYLNNAFATNYNRNPVRHHQNFINQSFNMSSQNMMDQIFILPPSLAEAPYGNQVNNSFSVMPSSTPNTMIPSQDKAPLLVGRPEAPGMNEKNSRMRRRNNGGDESSLYEIDLDRVVEDGRSTLMVRNIPNKYDLTLIMQTIEKSHKGRYDFFYLPIDFSNRCNFGYAFINFTEVKHIKDFYNEFHGKKWEKFNSEKICEIRYARIQGHMALMQHFQYSRVMNQQDRKLKPYIPPKYGFQNKQKLEELVRQQKLESGKEIGPRKQNK